MYLRRKSGEWAGLAMRLKNLVGAIFTRGHANIPPTPPSHRQSTIGDGWAEDDDEVEGWLGVGTDDEKGGREGRGRGEEGARGGARGAARAEAYRGRGKGGTMYASTRGCGGGGYFAPPTCDARIRAGDERIRQASNMQTSSQEDTSFGGRSAIDKINDQRSSFHRVRTAVGKNRTDVEVLKPSPRPNRTYLPLDVPTTDET